MERKKIVSGERKICSKITCPDNLNGSCKRNFKKEENTCEIWNTKVKNSIPSKHRLTLNN